MKSKRQKIILSTNCKDAKENIRKWMRQSLENTVIKRDDLDCREQLHFNSGRCFKFSERLQDNPSSKLAQYLWRQFQGKR